MSEQAEFNLESTVMELIINAGEARSFAMQALRAAKQHNWSQVDVLLTQASQASKRAHDVQTMLIGLDEGTGKIPVNLIMVHAQDHIMTSMLAREMIEGGKVHYNGQRSKPSKIVELNATLTLRQGNDERTVIVKAITEQRRPASEAALLYEETAESVEKREKMALARKLNALTMPHPDRRPDKKERRDLLRFKHGDSE